MNNLKIRSIFIHAGVWLIFMLMPVFFMGVNRPGGSLDLEQSLINANFWLFNVSYILLFYVNTYYLIPRFYLEKKYAAYGIILAVLLFGFGLLKPFHHMVDKGKPRPGMPEGRRPPELSGEFMRPPGPENFGRPPGPPEPFHFDITSCFLFIMITALGLVIQSIKQWQLTEKRALKAETEKANAELSYLKAQINPHFLFNTLNSIYALAITKSDYTATAVVKLSGMMRYLISESQAEFVPLEKEISYLSDYIELQKIRLGNTVNFSYHVTGTFSGKTIAPLILIAFIENAFKYGVNPEENSRIKIAVAVKENFLLLTVENNKVNNQISEEEKTGLGLANAKSRLQFLYPGKHELTLKETETEFAVSLKMNLS